MVTKEDFTKRNIAALAAQFDEKVRNLVSCLNDTETMVAAITILNGVELKLEELPQIPDNDVAEDVKAYKINPLTGDITISFIRKRIYKWNGKEYEEKQLDVPRQETLTISYQKYVNMVPKGYYNDIA